MADSYSCCAAKGDARRFCRGRLSRLVSPITWLVVVVSFAAGCGGADLSEQVSADAFDRETAVFDRMRPLDFASIAASYAVLDSLSYRLDTETRQIGDDGRTIATESRRLRMRPGGDSVERVAAHGAMTEGFMTFAVAGDSIPDQSRRLMELWVPAEPAFTSARNREYYRYAQAPDTVLAGEACHMFHVEALDGVSPDKMPIRRARIAVAASDSVLLWLRISRQDDALFYSERSELTLRMSRTGRSRIRPASREVSVTVEAPLRAAHRFASMQTYLFDEISGEAP